jgi:hypothetical protein
VAKRHAPARRPRESSTNAAASAAGSHGGESSSSPEPVRPWPATATSWHWSGGSPAWYQPESLGQGDPSGGDGFDGGETASRLMDAELANGGGDFPVAGRGANGHSVSPPLPPPPMLEQDCNRAEVELRTSDRTATKARIAMIDHSTSLPLRSIPFTPWTLLGVRACVWWWWGGVDVLVISIHN